MCSVKKFRRGIMSVLLVLGLVLGCACKKSQPESDSDSSAFSPYYSTTNQIFSIPHVIDGGFSKEGAFVQTFFESDEFWDAYHEQCIPTIENGGVGLRSIPVDENGKEITPENLLLILDKNGQIKETYDLNEKCGASTGYRKMYCTGDSCWILTEHEIQGGRTEYFIDCIDAEKGLTKHIGVDSKAGSGRLNSIRVGDDGQILLSSLSGSIFVLEEDGTVKDTIHLPEVCKYGDIAVWNQKLTSEGLGSQDIQVLFQYDEKTGKWTETDIPVTENWHRLLVRDGDLLSIGMSQIDRLGGDSEQKLNLEEASVFGTVQDIRKTGNGEMDLLVSPMSDDMIILYHLKPSDKKTYENKKEFVIAGYNLIESPLPLLVEKLSLLHPDVNFVMRDYMDEVDAEGDKAQIRNEIYRIMSLDLANGTAPDMYFDCENELGLGELGRLGYLKDLSPYLNDLNKEDYFIEKITMGKETPYCACLSFNILGFEASPRYVENTDIWTYEDFYKSAEKFTDLSCVQSIYSQKKLLEHGVLAQLDEFTPDGKANFTSEDFLNLLKWANDIGKKSDWDEYTEAGLDDGLFMLDWMSISSPGSVIGYRDHILVGFPNENGSLHVIPYNLLAVSVTTKQDELAQKIIRYAVSEEFQNNNPALLSGAMPVNRKAWEDAFEEQYQYYADDPRYQDHSKEEYHEMAMTAIARADHYLYGPRSVLDIVLEEAEVYFSGNCSAEHAAELIQNRVEIYLQETST